MSIRFNVVKDTPQLYEALMALNTAIGHSDADARLVHLVKIRISQINGCAYCVDMHIKEALQHGIDQTALNLLAVWRETTRFDARERAALSWAEALTMLPRPDAADEAYNMARAEFSEAELAALTVAIGSMNLWNRIGVGARMQA